MMNDSAIPSDATLRKLITSSIRPAPAAAATSSATQAKHYTTSSKQLLHQHAPLHATTAAPQQPIYLVPTLVPNADENAQETSLHRRAHECQLKASSSLQKLPEKLHKDEEHKSSAAPSTTSLIQLHASPSSHPPHDACTRRLCTSSFEVGSEEKTIRLYWSRHQVEQQHFEAPQSDIERELRAQLKAVDAELKELTRSKHLVDRHMEVLHQYNDIKDIGQALMGKCAEMEGKTTKDMYEKFEMELED